MTATLKNHAPGTRDSSGIANFPGKIDHEGVRTRLITFAMTKITKRTWIRINTIESSGYTEIGRRQPDPELGASPNKYFQVVQAFSPIRCNIRSTAQNP